LNSWIGANATIMPCVTVGVCLQKLPANRPDIQSLFESMTPYFDSGIPPTDELIRLKMIEGYKDGSKRRTTKSATTAKKYPTFALKWVSKTCRTFRGFSKSNSAMRRRNSKGKCTEPFLSVNTKLIAAKVRKYFNVPFFLTKNDFFVLLHRK
jgi:hypothetical protein